MIESLKLVFCGTPAFAVPTLETLVTTGFSVRLVVTQPDRPKGRGQEVKFSPVKQRALELGLPITQPDKVKNNEEFRRELEATRPEVIVVVGYGRLVPQWMLDLPPLGNINLHASLLPKCRGAAPIQWAIANGEEVTGVTTMRIDAGLDTGDILLQKEVRIDPEDSSEELSPRLAAIGAELMVETLHGLQAGTLHPTPQKHAEASLAPLLTREDGRVDFHRPARQIWNRLRGFQPWPGAYTNFRGRNVHIWRAQPVDQHLPPAELKLEGDHVIVGCGEGTALELLELQPEGKKRMSARDFIHGYHPQSGQQLG
jgi:methionyl-tRNA formyltransferase